MKKSNCYLFIVVVMLICSFAILTINAETTASTDYSIQYRCREKKYTVSREELTTPWILYDTKSESEHLDKRVAIADPFNSEDQSAMTSACKHNVEYVYKYYYSPYGEIQQNTYWYGTEEEFQEEKDGDWIHWVSDGYLYTRYEYCTKINYYTSYYYYMWSEWTDWGKTVYTPDEDTEVEERKVYEITYDANGGKDAPDGQFKIIGEDLTLASTIPWREEYVFLGWATSTIGAEEYSVCATYSTDANVTLYAVWKPMNECQTLKTYYRFREKIYTTTTSPIIMDHSWILYDTETKYTHTNFEYVTKPADYSGMENSYCIHDKVYVNRYVNQNNTGQWFYATPSEFMNMSATIRLNYTPDIKGYYKYKYCTTKIPHEIYHYYSWGEWSEWCETPVITSYEVEVETKSVELYTITYDANGGTGIPSSQTKTSAIDLILSDSAPERENCIFLGWADNIDGEVIYNSGDVYSVNSNVTLYAQWEIRYTITYDANGGTGFPESQTKTHGKDLLLSNVTPLRDGYIFLGWAESIHGEVIYYPGDTYSVDLDIELYAQWKVKEYTITYDANGGSNAPAAQIKTHGVVLTVCDSMPTRELYKFIGWSTTIDGEVEYQPNSVYALEGDNTLYAVWTTAQTYMVNYDANGGIGAPSSQIKTENLALTLSMNTPTRTGYVFTHWVAGKSLPVDTLESEHDYAYGTNQEWIVSSPGASSIELTFDDRTQLQKDYDFLYVYDSNGWRISKYTGKELAGKTINVQGDLVTLVLNTNYWNNYWGFAITSAIAYYDNYNPGDSFSTNTDMTFYAVWEVCTHEWDDGTIIVEPTHTTSGEALYLCTLCGETKTEEIAKPAEHTYGLWVDSGTTMHSKTCECGETVYADHSWDEGMITLQPTHTAVGVKTFACVDCNATRTEDVEKLSNHTYGEWQDTDYGYHQKICACGDAITENHTRDEGVVTRKPTHTSTGIMTYTCVVCGNRATLTIAKQQHTFGEWTRISDTQHSRSCECGAVETKAHDFTEWQTQLAATCTENGIEYRNCLTCGAEETQAIIANGHNYVSVVTDPNCNEQGYTTHTCSCGDTYTDAYTDALGHRIFWIGTELVESYTTQNDSKYPFTTDGEWYKSTNKTNKTSSTFTIRALYKCTLVLKYKVSCEEYWDYLKITVNGDEKTRISGIVSEKTTTLTLKAGDLLTITYYKDTRESANEDTGYFMIISCTKTEVDASKYISADDVEPTCTDAVVCDVCGQTVYNATGHIYNNDCDTDCNACGANRTAIHSYGKWTKVDDANHVRVCICEHIETQPHQWNSGEITLYPTISTTGTKVYTCSVCSATRKETLAKIQSYSVTYDANGGTGAPSAQIKAHDVDLTLTSSSPTRTGYIFMGWATSANGTAVYSAGDTFVANEDTTLYAVWKIKTYTITYDVGDGVGVPASQTKTHGTLITLSSKVPTREGYTFDGWTTSVNGGVVYEPGSSYTENADLTLYAVWVIKIYSITYNANGGDGVPIDETKEHFATYTVSDSIPEKEGYNFKGWSGSDGKTYLPGELYNGNADLNLTAIWQEKTYNVSYGANGGTGAPSAQTKCHFSDLVLTSNEPSRIGYIFIGWLGSNGKTYNPGDIYSDNADLTLDAIWEIKTYNITYDVSGGSNAPNSATKEHFATYTISNVIPTRYGYVFMGWQGSNGKSYSVSDTYSENADVTFTALWTAKSITLTYDACGGSVPTSSKTVRYERKIGTLDIPTRPGYTFVGWFTGKERGENVTENTIVDFLDAMTIYAHWSANSYTVTFDANGGATPFDSKTVVFDSKYGNLPVPTKKGYTFVTWSKTKTISGVVNAETIYQSTSDTTLYAIWEANTYKLTFDALGGKIDIDYKTVTYGSAYGDLPISLYPNYIFGGWFFEKEYKNKLTSNTIVTIDGDHTVYAMWIPANFTVVYDANGGEGAPSQQTKTLDVDLTLSDMVPTRKGYIFKGWSTTSDGVVSYASGATYSKNANLTLYAVWETIKYGDPNGDGIINAKDAVLLAQHLANWDICIDIFAADCNGDETVNAKDAVLLAQYLANWDVTLG